MCSYAASAAEAAAAAPLGRTAAETCRRISGRRSQSDPKPLFSLRGALPRLYGYLRCHQSRELFGEDQRPAIGSANCFPIFCCLLPNSWTVDISTESFIWSSTPPAVPSSRPEDGQINARFERRYFSSRLRRSLSFKLNFNHSERGSTCFMFVISTPNRNVSCAPFALTRFVVRMHRFKSLHCQATK